MLVLFFIPMPDIEIHAVDDDGIDLVLQWRPWPVV